MSRSKTKTGQQSVSQIIRLLESYAPSGAAEKWDNVGLLVGDPDWETLGAVVSVDLTAEALEAARRKGYRLIINHHPCIFPKSKGLSSVTAQDPHSRLVHQAIREGIAVASYHTNFDQCALEVPQLITQSLGVKPLGRLIDGGSGALLKLAVFVPSSHLEQVRSATTEAGAGHIGDYDSCTFQSPGEGTFRGQKGTHPFIGKPGQLESAQEHRLETIFPKGLKKPILKALRKAHPYEEIAYDLYPVEQAPSGQGMVRGLGYGFWGDLPKPRGFQELAQQIKELFNVNGFMLTQPVPKRIQRIGFVAGKGASFVDAAIAVGCDLFITGEAGYHTALAGKRQGIAILELGHRESEIFFPKTVASWLNQAGLKSSVVDVPTQKIWI